MEAVCTTHPPDAEAAPVDPADPDSARIDQADTTAVLPDPPDPEAVRIDPTDPSGDHPDPPDSVPARIDRMDRVAVLFGEITAATRAFLAALAETDRHRDWAEEGFGSCAEWLAWRIGVTRNTANEKVRAARALEGLPLTSEAMARGEISFSKVRALTRAATPENEAELLELAKAGSAANLERVIRGWRTMDRRDEARAEKLRHHRRTFSVFPGDDGMYVVKGRLTPEVGAALMRAVEAASDALFRESHRRDSGNASNDPSPEPRQLRADAVGLLAERALAGGFGRPDDPAPVSGTRAERYQVMVHVDADVLREDHEGAESSRQSVSNGPATTLCELEDGTRVTAETARRLSCDAGRVEVRKRSDGSILDVGRRTRTIPPALRRALDARDRGCRFPGRNLRFTDAHHIIHWADGGETSLANTLLLCRRHHRRVHEEGWMVCSDRRGEAVVFFTPDGKAIGAAPPPPPLPSNPLENLVRRNRERGARPDWKSGMPRWRRDLDIPWAIEAAAREALDPWEEVGHFPSSAQLPR